MCVNVQYEDVGWVGSYVYSMLTVSHVDGRVRRNHSLLIKKPSYVTEIKRKRAVSLREVKHHGPCEWPCQRLTRLIHTKCVN